MTHFKFPQFFNTASPLPVPTSPLFSISRSLTPSHSLSGRWAIPKLAKWFHSAGLVIKFVCKSPPPPPPPPPPIPPCSWPSATLLTVINIPTNTPTMAVRNRERQANGKTKTEGAWAKREHKTDYFPMKIPHSYILIREAVFNNLFYCSNLLPSPLVCTGLVEVGDSGRGKDSKGGSWLVKAGRDNANEEDWLNPAHPVHLISTLHHEYLYWW